MQVYVKSYIFDEHFVEARQEDCFLLRTGSDLRHGGRHEEVRGGDVRQLPGEILG